MLAFLYCLSKVEFVTSEVLAFTIAEFVMQSRDPDCLYSTGGRGRSRETFPGLVDVFGIHLPSCINNCCISEVRFCFGWHQNTRGYYIVKNVKCSHISLSKQKASNECLKYNTVKMYQTSGTGRQSMGIVNNITLSIFKRPKVYFLYKNLKT